MDKPTVFISYSHKDEKWKDRLLPHLRALEKVDRIVVWDDRKIDAGDQWYPEIKEAMEKANLALCLISPNYLASDFCVKEEVPFLLQRCEKAGMILIPILLKPCTWEIHEWVSATQMLPRDGKAVSPHFRGKEDSVFVEVARTILKRLFDPTDKPPAPPPPKWPPLDKDHLDLDRLPSTGSDLFGRQKELALLDEAWASASTNIISFVAWGGVGKSTLVNKWLDGLQKDNYRGARRVYAWSFYSQGTSERATSADLFINAALIWFGDADPTAGSPWDKGQRLADLVRREKTLLLLDGMEPLQSSLAYERGKIKDPALATLVTELARENPGLCVITTREWIAELDDGGISTGSGSDRVLPAASNADDQLATARRTVPARQINLELLSPEAGRALLRVGGVRGTDEELEKATEDFGCHALALNLLALYLQDIPGHHISATAKIPDLDVPEEEGKHPRRLIAAFEQKFGEGPEVNALRLLGLFDRPAGGKSIAALRKAPAIPGLTDHIQASSEAEWLRAVQRLRKYKLIAEESHHAPDELDAHPLVRENFRQQLKREHPEAWREGNNRLYEHLTRTANEFPETIEEMSRLYAAVAHGCEAGRHQEVLDDVYKRRIHRGEQSFSVFKLGTFGTDVAALANFFDLSWSQPVGGLNRSSKTFVQGRVGYYLRTLGRMEEAASPMQAGLEASIVERDWNFAEKCARHLSGYYRIVGDLSLALKYAKQNIKLAKRCRDNFTRIAGWTTWAHVLHQTGQFLKAEAAFRHAEEIQKETDPLFPFLYSYPGYRYCDLLLTQRKYSEVIWRASQTLERKEKKYDLYDIYQDHLSLGRAYLLQAQQESIGDFAQASIHMKQAMEGLRRTGKIDELPYGLVALAEFHLSIGELQRAQADLNEAMSIATRGSMMLQQADCHLAYARLYLAQGEKGKARASWADAKEMIERMGYHRRDKDVAEIEQQLAGLEKTQQTE